jgi:hypothetical protein
MGMLPIQPQPFINIAGSQSGNIKAQPDTLILGLCFEFMMNGLINLYVNCALLRKQRGYLSLDAFRSEHTHMDRFDFSVFAHED